MKCPHCLENFFEDWRQFNPYSLIDNDQTSWRLQYCECPSCRRNIISLGKVSGGHVIWKFVQPKAISRTPLPKEIPQEFAEDYKEACLVLADSPKASAALSRRCLQNLLREKAKVKHADLYNEIQEVINTKKLKE